jgi:hypothetical protein
MCVKSVNKPQGGCRVVTRYVSTELIQVALGSPGKAENWHCSASGKAGSQSCKYSLPVADATGIEVGDALFDVAA